MTVVVLLASFGCGAADVVADSDAVLIVEYDDNAVRTAAEAQAAAAARQGGGGQQGDTLVTAGIGLQSSLDAAAAAAARSAKDRGASPFRRDSLATLAAESVAVGPAVAALTSSVVAAAQSAGVKVTGLTNYHTVLQGAAIKTATVQDASLLRRILRNTPSVKKVHSSVSSSSQM